MRETFLFWLCFEHRWMNPFPAEVMKDGNSGHISLSLKNVCARKIFNLPVTLSIKYLSSDSVLSVDFILVISISAQTSKLRHKELECDFLKVVRARIRIELMILDFRLTLCTTDVF